MQGHSFFSTFRVKIAVVVYQALQKDKYWQTPKTGLGNVLHNVSQTWKARAPAISFPLSTNAISKYAFVHFCNFLNRLFVC